MFNAGDKVDRPGWGDDQVYTVVDSHFHRTNVVTDDGVDISFATSDLRKIVAPHNSVEAKVVGNTVRVYLTNKEGSSLSTGLTVEQAISLAHEIFAAAIILED